MSPPSRRAPTPIGDYEYEERAAILEYEAGLTREQAEQEARRQQQAVKRGSKQEGDR